MVVSKWEDSNWINEDEKIIFFGLQKNGSTSIRQNLKLVKRVDLNNLKKGLYDDFIMFTVIREPLDRFASGFVETIERAMKTQNGVRSKKFFNIPEFDRKVEMFITECEEDFFDGHIRPQSTSLFFQLKPKNGIIINFHNMNKDLIKHNIVSEGFNLMVVNKSKKPNDKLRVKQLLNSREDLVNRLKTLYEKDFNIYNKMINDEI